MKNWPQKVSKARTVWDKLTVEELFKTGGDIQKLVGLVQIRYAINRSEASKQVTSFLEYNKS